MNKKMSRKRMRKCDFHTGQNVSISCCGLMSTGIRQISWYTVRRYFKISIINRNTTRTREPVCPISDRTNDLGGKVWQVSGTSRPTQKACGILAEQPCGMSNIEGNKKIHFTE